MRKSHLITLLAMCLILLSKLVSGQEYSYVNYNIKDGLAGSVVYCMVQDHDGFIWFGTETGLSRFDGSRFKNFTTADGLPDNEILQLYVDSKNRMWITSFQNKVCYYRNGELHTTENDTLLKQLQFTGYVAGVVENNKQEIAIVQTDGLTIIQPNGEVIAIHPPAGEKFLGFNLAGLDFDGSFLVNVIFADTKEVNLYKVNGKNLVHAEVIAEFPRLKANSIYLSKDLRFFYKFPDSLVFFTGQGRFSVPAPANFVNFSRPNDSIVAIASLDYTELINIRSQKNEGRFLEKENISSVLQDREGNLWFTSMGNGVYRLASRNFKTVTLPVNGRNQSVYSLARIGETLFMGSDNFYLWKLNLGNNRLEKIRIFNPHYNGRITTLIAPDGESLLAGSDIGLAKLNVLKGDLTRASINFAVKSIFADMDTIYVGHNIGTEKFGFHSLDQRGLLYHVRTTAVYKRSDSLFLGTLNGLYIMSGNGKIDSPSHLNKALTGRISAIKGTDDGTVWIGTYGSGIVSYRKGRFILLNRDSGLTSNIVRSLYPQGNDLWVGTDKGVNKVEPQNGGHKITRYTSADGIISDIINAVYVKGSTVYVGTPAGITWFREGEAFTNSMCVLKLNGIRSAMKEVVGDTAHLRFDHYDRDIRFEFTGISFKSAGEITYRYRLAGLDKNWQTTRQNFLQYPTLPSGEYKLELQATNKFGVESALLKVNFVVESLLWERTWFRILAVFSLILLVWIFVAWRIRKIRGQEAIKLETNRKLAELEQMALRAQMNPHFIFNSLNSIQHYVFEKDIVSANRFLTEFSGLIRMTLDISGKAKISLEDEIKYLSTYLELEKKRYENKFVYQMQVSEAIDPALCYIPPMILQPYVENSIRHGIRFLPDNNGLIKLEFSIVDEYLVCSVEDNGIGRKKSEELKGRTVIEYQSQGMTLTARRIKMMNNNFSHPMLIVITDIYEGEVAKGTRVVIRIPLPETSKPFNNL